MRRDDWFFVLLWMVLVTVVDERCGSRFSSAVTSTLLLVSLASAHRFDDDVTKRYRHPVGYQAAAIYGGLELV